MSSPKVLKKLPFLFPVVLSRTWEQLGTLDEPIARLVPISVASAALCHRPKGYKITITNYPPAAPPSPAKSSLSLSNDCNAAYTLLRHHIPFRSVAPQPHPSSLSIFDSVSFYSCIRQFVLQIHTLPGALNQSLQEALRCVAIRSGRLHPSSAQPGSARHHSQGRQGRESSPNPARLACTHVATRSLCAAHWFSACSSSAFFGEIR